MEHWEACGLDPRKQRLVTLVGGGGKTTLLYVLAREAWQSGLRVIITTTTRLYPHPALPLAGRGTEAVYRQKLAQRGILVVGIAGPGDKLGDAGCLDACLAAADVVLVEGDGAKGLPLKAPAEHEPVIPARADAVLAVAGLDSLGKSISTVCHRPEQVAQLLEKSLESAITPADVVKLMTHPAGGKKGVPPGAVFRCVLNKADTPQRQAAAGEILWQLQLVGVIGMVTQFGKEERDGRCWY